MNVSILIPCYNAVDHVERAIESALAQTCGDADVIVVDDGSRDGSLDRILRFGSRIRVACGPNRGGNAARNRLLKLARGRWLQYLDADDFLLPDKIERQLKEAGSDSTADVLYSPVLIEEPVADGKLQRTEHPILLNADPWELLIRWQLPQTGAALWRRSTLQRLGGWNEAQTVCQEHELYLRALTAGCSFQRTASAGAVYRIWSEETVCRRDPLKTFRAKMSIVGRAVDELQRRGEFTDARRDSAATARLECARAVYGLDRAFADQLVASARTIAPGYCPPIGPAFPPAWRWLFRTLGFQTAERVAAFKRRIFPNSELTG